MSNRLLPVGSSPLEVAAAAACAKLENVPVPLRELWDPLACPLEFLPYLAWALSVDRWDENWPETEPYLRRDASPDLTRSANLPDVKYKKAPKYGAFC